MIAGEVPRTCLVATQAVNTAAATVARTVSTATAAFSESETKLTPDVPRRSLPGTPKPSTPKPPIKRGFACEWALVFHVSKDAWQEASWRLRTGPEQIEFIDEILADGINEQGLFPRERLNLKIYESWLEFRIALLNALLELLSSEECAFGCELFRSVGEGWSFFDGWNAESASLLVLARLPERSAWKHAVSLGYHLELDADVARQMRLPPPEPGQKPYAQGHACFNVGLLAHYADTYRRPLFRGYRDFCGGSSSGSSSGDTVLFRMVDYIRLMRHTIAKHVDLENLIYNGIITTHFPLHSSSELAVLQESWTRMWLVVTWRQPLDDVQAYFGEEIALYFAWLGFQARIMAPLAVIGAIAEFLLLVYGDTWWAAASIQWVCGTGVVFWAAVYIRCWHRKDVYASS